MERVTDISTLQRLKEKGALVILFGGESCNVCNSLQPRLRLMLEQDFPGMRGVYVDCAVSPEICAQHGVFTLPVVKAFIEGMMIAEEVGVFSIGELRKTLDRPYSIWQSS
jgi:thioredoxin-like negative regulator of GroEL